MNEQKSDSKGNVKSSLQRCHAGSKLFNLSSLLLALFLILFLNSYVFAEGLNLLSNIEYTTTEQTEDDEDETKSSTFRQNYYLTLNKKITPKISYQLYVRTTLNDLSFTDSLGNTTKNYSRAIEPAIDFFLSNSVYNVNLGYRRHERWTTAKLKKESRMTEEYYYSRFNLTPRDFPSLSIQIDRQKNYDYLSPKITDSTVTSYSGNSGYQTFYKDFKLGYNLNYVHRITKTPVSTTSKTIDDNFSALYNIGYSRIFWNNKLTIFSSYQGNYIRNKRRQFVSETGSVVFMRTPQTGRWALGPDLANRSVDSLAADGLLIDNDRINPTGYNIGANGFLYYNIGLEQLSSGKSVDRMFIYVNKDVRLDVNLTNPANWEIYWSNTNIPGTIWTSIPVSGVTVTQYDVFNNIYLVEITFTSTTARYFKAVNLATATINDVFVTEVEAYGTDIVPSTGELSEVTEFFTQGLSISAGLRPLKKLSFSLNFYLNRSDQTPESILNSISGMLTNVFIKPETELDKAMITNVTRTFAISSTWLTHRLLTTTFNFQRNEAFDNKDTTDIKSNTYSLSFSSSPLQSINTSLSLIRTDSYSFGEKQMNSNSILLSIGSRLYRDVNMVNDIGYTESKSYTNDTETSSRFITGSIHAIFTKKLSGNINYGFNWISSESTSSDSQEGKLQLTYRPGRFVNISGSYKILNTDSNITLTREFLMDWLPLPAIRLNLDYKNTYTELDSSTADTISSYLIWYITKFINAQLTYSYTLEKNDTKTEIHTFSGNLNCTL